MTTLALVVNPAAGHGRARRLLPHVTTALFELVPGAALTVHEATSYDGARAACRDAVASGVDGLVVMGGDGMAHLGLNACAGTEVPLGVVPAGTGNDFCRGVGLPLRWRDAVAAIATGGVRTIDLMRVAGATASGDPEYVGSIVSTGFDEKVNHRTNTLPFSIGAPSYAWSVLVELRRFTPLRYRLVVDGEPRELDAILVAVGNAGVFGGGIRMLPDADVTDGELDVTIVHPAGLGTLVKAFPGLYRDGVRGVSVVEMLRAREVVVDGDDLWSMADGEKLGRVPLTCSVAPGALRLFAP